MRLFITGGSGQVGRALRKRLPPNWTVWAPSSQQWNLENLPEGLATLDTLRPDWVVHLAAWTDVDGCERDPARAFRINTEATAHLARWAARKGVRFLFISTDFVFDGAKRRPYTEDDPPHPLQVYGETKQKAEVRILEWSGEYWILRTSWVYGEGKNFVLSVLKWAQQYETLRIAMDQESVPTSAEDLAQAILCLLHDPPSPGVYHVTHPDSATRVAWVQAILEICGIRKNIQPVPSSTFPNPAKRPVYSVLSTERWQRYGCYAFPSWKEALKRYLQEQCGF